MLDRRDLIRRAGLTALAGFGGGSFAPLRALAGNTAALPFGNGERPLVAYPGKRPLLLPDDRAPAAAGDPVPCVRRGAIGHA